MKAWTVDKLSMIMCLPSPTGIADSDLSLRNRWLQTYENLPARYTISKANVIIFTSISQHSHTATVLNGRIRPLTKAIPMSKSSIPYLVVEIHRATSRKRTAIDANTMIGITTASISRPLLSFKEGIAVVHS